MPAEWTDAELEQLSAYIDQQLDDSDRMALEARLAQDEALQRELVAMRQTAALLRSLPTIRAPRAFTLTPEMLGQTAVPALALSESARVVPMPTARPARRVWWVPAASAAAVVLLAGVFLITQTSNRDAPSAGAINQGVAQVSTNTPSPALDGSAYNTVVQAVATQQPTATSEITMTLMKIDDQAPILPPGTVSPGDDAVPQTQVMAAPMQPANTSEPPRFSPTFAPTQTNAGDVPIIAPSSMSNDSAMSAASSAATSDPLLEMASGGGPAQTTGAVAGMDGINSDPNAPGFTVATLSPQQGTAIAEYSTPSSDETVTTSSAQSPSPADKRGMSLWLEWLTVLRNWLRVLFPGS